MNILVQVADDLWVNPKKVVSLFVKRYERPENPWFVKMRTTDDSWEWTFETESEANDKADAVVSVLNTGRNPLPFGGDLR